MSGDRAGKVYAAIAGDEVRVRGTGVAGQRHRRERLARRCGVDDEGLRVGGGGGVAGQIGDRDLEIVVGAGRQRGVERPVAANHGGRAEQRRPVKHLHAGNAGAASVGNRAGKVHPATAGDEVGVRGAGVAGQRHRRERLARRCGVDDEGLRVGGGGGVAGQVGDRDLEIVVGAGRQRGVERPVAANHGGRAEQRRPVKHLHAGNAGAASVGNRAGKVHPAIAGDEVGVRGPGVAGQRHRRERLARRCRVERVAVAGARRRIVGRINAAYRQRTGAR